MLLYALARHLLFRVEAERAHGLVLRSLCPLEALLERWSGRTPDPVPGLGQELFGLRFPNPVGLAAGLDKNADLPHVWPVLGFGFVEVGTVTGRPQSGNPRPRLFRIPEEKALINRMGFNNRGADRVAARLARRFRRRRCAVPLGINIGKSKAVPLDEAAADYRHSLRALFRLADYVTVNVSSPNTPGLRDLQSEARLAELLDALQAENRRLGAWAGRGPLPLLVKVSPDLPDDALRAVVQVALKTRAAGLIATNTTIQRPSSLPSSGASREEGGLSGAPLGALSTRVVGLLYRESRGRLPIVGVGGIFSAGDAYAKIRAGASLIQVYTSLVYEGPGLPRAICAGLQALLRRDGFGHLSEAVGCDA